MLRSLALALLFVATAAHAGPRQTREAADPGKLVLRDQPRPRVVEEPTPALGGDAWMEIEQETIETLQLLAAEYQHLVDETPDDDPDAKADAWFRLAETHGRIARYWRLRTQELLIAKKQKKAKAAAASHKEASKAARAAFAELAGNQAFRGYPRMDRALFLYGHALQQAGLGDDARKIYQRLIKEYPSSGFVAEARLAFGDWYFEQAELEPDQRAAHLENARAEYGAVMDLPNTTLHPYARYRQGWVEVNLGAHQEALEAFHEVTELTRGDPDRKTLRRAAEKDLVRAYAEVGNAEKAHKYFQKIDKKDAFEMLRILAETYVEKGKDPKAIYTFRALMKLDPEHADVCLWQYEVAHATLRSGTKPEAVAEIEHLVDVYAAVKGDECRELASAMSGDLARTYHQEWARTLEEASLGHAISLYGAYLDAFAADDTDGMTEYFYADLLWARTEAAPKAKAWDQVAAAFDAVVARGKVDAKHLEEAAYAAVLARDNALAADPRLTGEPRDDDGAPAPVAIPARERELIAAIDRYFAAVAKPKLEIAIDLRFVQAAVYRRFDHLDEALPLLVGLVEDHRATEKGAIAADLLLHALNRLGRHDELAAWVERLLADEAWLADRDDLRARLRELRQTARRKRAERCEADAAAADDPALHVACGEQYFAIFNDDPDAARADEVLYNAAVSFEQGKSLGVAIELYESLAEMFPKSKVTARAIRRTGEAYARIAWYDKAAERLETYAKKYAGEDDAHAAMNDAVLYRKGTGDHAKAIADTRFYVDTFAKQDPASAAAAHYSLAAIYEQQGELDKAVAHLRKYLDRFGDDGGVERVVAAYTKIGAILWAQACEVKAIDGSCVKVKRQRAVRGERGRASSTTPTRCGSDDKIALTVVERDEALVRKARKAFGKAIAAYEGAKLTGDAAKVAKAAYAQAVFHRAEVAYEDFLDLPFPTNLDFGSDAKSARSLKRFDAWMADKLARGTLARERFDAVLAIKDPAAAVAAAARLGQLQQHFSDALFSAPIPASVDTEEGIEIYCDVLTEKAEPLELASIDAFGFCLETSTKLGWFSEWSRLCERELGQIRPEEYPTASELRAAPDALALVTTLEAAVLKLP